MMTQQNHFDEDGRTRSELTGGGGWGAPRLNFHPTYILHLQPPGSWFSPLPGPGFWLQVVFAIKMHKTLYFYLKIKKKFSREDAHSPSPEPSLSGEWGGQPVPTPTPSLLFLFNSDRKGHWGTCPLDFQLFNFSCHFRAAQTLTLDSMWGCLPRTINTLAYSYETVYWKSFIIIFLCVTLKLFLLCFVPSSHQKRQKGKGQYSTSWEPHLRATGHAIVIWDHTVLPATWHKWMRPAESQPCRLVLDLPTPEGWKAELT